MMDENWKDIFLKLFKAVMAVDKIDEGYTLKNLPQWDSLKTVELIVEIENAFQITISRNRLPEMNALSNIISVLEEHYKEQLVLKDESLAAVN